MSKSNGESSKTRKKLQKQANPLKDGSKEIDQRIFVLPDKYTCSSNIIVSLRDPHTEEGRKYLYDEGNKTVCEILQYSEQPRSWFVGDTVQKDGSLYICTPMDPIFLILPYLMKSAKGRYVLLNQILEDHEFPHVTRLEACVDEDQLANICDTTSSAAVTTGLLYRYNEEKTLVWVKKKIDKLAAALQEEQVDVGVGSKSQLLKRSNNPNNSIANYNCYATSLVSSYLPPSLSKKFTSDTTNEPDCEIFEPASKRKKVNANPDNPTEDYSTFNMPQPTKSSRPTKMTPAQKALAKVDKKNIKPLTKFFGKKSK